MSGYNHNRVRRFLAEHGTVREDGRVMRLNHRSLPESFRNTLATWLERGDTAVPLGRWDELLLSVDLMLWEYEDWELETYGDLSYTEDGSSSTSTPGANIT